MGLLTEKRTERIDLGDGDWVDILVDLPVKEACEIQELADKGLTDQALGLLVAVIVAWSDAAPVTPENIAGLRAELAATIMQRFNERMTAVLNPKVSSLPSIRSSRARERSRMPTS